MNVSRRTFLEHILIGGAGAGICPAARLGTGRARRAQTQYHRVLYR